MRDDDILSSDILPRECLRSPRGYGRGFARRKFPKGCHTITSQFREPVDWRWSVYLEMTPTELEQQPFGSGYALQVVPSSPFLEATQFINAGRRYSFLEYSSSRVSQVSQGLWARIRTSGVFNRLPKQSLQNFSSRALGLEMVGLP